MRALSPIIAALLLTAAFAGCIGGKDGDGEGATLDPADTNGGTGTGTGTGSGTGTLKVLAPLNATITLDAPAWVQSGTEVPVALGTPANAKGAVTYAWAIGPLPGTSEVTAVTMDTGSAKSTDYIAPGASKTLTYSTAGIYRMHCHPHPAMRHNVTVIDGYEGAKNVEVQIVDGSQGQYYVPENIVIGTGTTVTYKNVGQQPHTATALGAQEPALKALPLKADKGAIKVEGEGWQRVVAVYLDSEGRIGVSEARIYTTSTLPVFETQTETFSFEYGASELAGTPAAPASDGRPVLLKQPGVVTINYTFTDLAGSVDPSASQASVELHFTKDGETQDTLTGDGAENSLNGKAIAGSYTLSVLPTSGVQIEGTVTIEVVYELLPPEPTMPAAPADDGHGGHAH